MPGHLDDDTFVTALDGRMIDASADVGREAVRLTVLGTDTLVLTASGARILATQLLAASATVDRPLPEGP